MPGIIVIVRGNLFRPYSILESNVGEATLYIFAHTMSDALPAILPWRCSRSRESPLVSLCVIVLLKYLKISIRAVELLPLSLWVVTPETFPSNAGIHSNPFLKLFAALSNLLDEIIKIFYSIYNYNNHTVRQAGSQSARQQWHWHIIISIMPPISTTDTTSHIH